MHNTFFAWPTITIHQYTGQNQNTDKHCGKKLKYLGVTPSIQNSIKTKQVWNFSSHPEERTQIESAWKQSAKEDMWT
jgi:hypothetical protein